jgi:putative oxidoreductase
MAGMIEGVISRTFAPLLLRAALAAVFIYHGLDKVRPETNFGTNWDQHGLVQGAALQALVAWGELLGGVAVALGILTRYAAVGLIIIMVGAIVTVHGTKGFGMQGGGYEYNFVLIMVAAALAITGPGTMSLDRVINLKMRGPAKY